MTKVTRQIFFVVIVFTTKNKPESFLWPRRKQAAQLSFLVKTITSTRSLFLHARGERWPFARCALWRKAAACSDNLTIIVTIWQSRQRHPPTSGSNLGNAVVATGSRGRGTIVCVWYEVYFCDGSRFLLLVVPGMVYFIAVVVVVFTLNRSFYPTTSAIPPVSFLILHPREILRSTNYVVTDSERKTKR